MAITLNGSGTVSGISAGGLPDGIIQSADLATGVGGKILQVKQSFKNNTQSLSGTQAYTLIQGLGTTMTLSNSNNKILVNIHLTHAQSASNYAIFRLYDGSSAITAAHSTGASSLNTSILTYLNANQANSYVNASFSYLYAPGDTNAHTINLYGNPFNTTIYINSTGNTNSYGTSSMTLMEVAA